MGKDSFCKTAMSRREDILSCIDVTIMDRSANTALPSSYSKTLPAFRAGAAVTHAAGLSGKRFVDFLEPHACVSAFVLQHGSKCTPPRIEHRLRLSSLSQGRGIHVADENCTVASHEAGAQLVQEIFSAVPRFGVNRPGTVSFVRPLRAAQGRLKVAVKALGIDRRHTRVTEGRQSLQSQINSEARNRAIEDRLCGRLISLARRSRKVGHADIQIPASPTVFAEVTGTQIKSAQAKAVPQREPASCEIDLPCVVAKRSDLEGNPAQRASGTAALAPGQTNLSMLAASPGIFLRDLLHGLNGNIQSTIAARHPLEEGPEIKPGQKAPFALIHFDGQFVAVIKERVDFACQPREPRSVLVLHPQAQDPNGGRVITGHPYSSPANSLFLLSKTSRKAGRARRATLCLPGLKTGVSRAEP